MHQPFEETLYTKWLYHLACAKCKKKITAPLQCCPTDNYQATDHKCPVTDSQPTSQQALQDVSHQCFGHFVSACAGINSDLNCHLERYVHLLVQYIVHLPAMQIRP